MSPRNEIFDGWNFYERLIRIIFLRITLGFCGILIGRKEWMVEKEDIKTFYVWFDVEIERHFKLLNYIDSRVCLLLEFIALLHSHDVEDEGHFDSRCQDRRYKRQQKVLLGYMTKLMHSVMWKLISCTLFMDR